MSEAGVVEQTQHGPFRRIVVTIGQGLARAQVSVYRFGDWLVDTGGTRVTGPILAALADDPPRRILLTHQHEDHVGNVGAIRRAFGELPVHAPRDCTPIIASTSEVPPYRAAFFGNPEPTPIDTLIPYDAGDLFEAEGVVLEAVHTPGHTPPHIALRAPQGDTVWLLSADLYTNRPLDGWIESATDDSIRTLRTVARDGARLRLLPTHGRTRDDAAQVLSAAADFLERESERVERESERLGTREARRVAASLYGADPFYDLTSGEICRAAFVRSVLEPVRALPARPLG